MDEAKLAMVVLAALIAFLIGAAWMSLNRTPEENRRNYTYRCIQERALPADDCEENARRLYP